MVRSTVSLVNSYRLITRYNFVIALGMCELYETMYINSTAKINMRKLTLKICELPFGRAEDGGYERILTYHLISKHEHSLQGELSLAVVEEIFQTRTK